MKKGDIVLTPFPFTDLTGSKRRPALVLVNGKSDITVAYISSIVQNRTENDFVLEPNPTNRLKVVSLLKLSKIATIDKSLIVGKTGQLETVKLKEVDEMLLELFQIGK